MIELTSRPYGLGAMGYIVLNGVRYGVNYDEENPIISASRDGARIIVNRACSFSEHDTLFSFINFTMGDFLIRDALNFPEVCKEIIDDHPDEIGSLGYRLTPMPPNIGKNETIRYFLDSNFSRWYQGKYIGAMKVPDDDDIAYIRNLLDELQE